MAGKAFNNVPTVVDGLVKVAALIALVLIIFIDQSSANFEAKEVELILAFYVAGAEAKSIWEKRKEVKK